MVKTISKLILGVVGILLAGCSALQLAYEAPTVSVNSFRVLPSDGIGPRFEIGLHVINPNSNPLNIRGISYTIVLEGHRLITGVASDLPIIEGYSEGDVLLKASADLVSGINLIADMLKGPRETFNYELNAKLDIGGFRPDIRVVKKGELSLPRKNR
jgi:hypothetical protein